MKIVCYGKGMKGRGMVSRFHSLAIHSFADSFLLRLFGGGLAFQLARLVAKGFLRINILQDEFLEVLRPGGQDVSIVVGFIGTELDPLVLNRIGVLFQELVQPILAQWAHLSVGWICETLKKRCPGRMIIAT